MIVKINGIEKFISKGSMSISTAIEERSTASFVVVDIKGKERYERGMNVEIFNDDNQIEFGGIIENSTETRIAGVGLFHNISCVDWHYLADKRIVAKRYENMYTGEIVKDLVDTYLVREGITYNEATTYLKDNIKPTFTSNGLITNTSGSLSLSTKGVPTLVTPIMTSNNRPIPNIVTNDESGVGTASTLFQAFNRNTVYAYVPYSSKDGWKIIFDFGIGNGKEIGKYGINQAFAHRYATGWTLSGFLESTGTWEVLDRQTGQIWATDRETKEYMLSGTTKKYRKYKLEGNEMEGVVNGSTFAIDEFLLYAPIDLAVQEGQIISSPITFPNVTSHRGVVINFNEQIPQGTSALVEYSVDEGATWFKVANGYVLPDLDLVQDLSKVKMLLRVTFKTPSTTVSPSISNFVIKVIDVVGSMQEGVFVQEVVFNYIPVSEAISSLSEKTGYWWDISPLKQIRYAERGTRKAPFTINTMTINKDSLTVENGNSQYRNQQYIIGGKDITDVQSESFVGNGNQQTFTVGYPIALVPKVYINNVQISVGIRGLDDKEGSNKQWFWSKGDNTITQLQEVAPLTSSQTLRVEYQGEFDVVVVSKDVDEIASTKAIEGGTGIVEVVDEDKGLTSRESAFQSASQKLERYGKKGRKIQFTTWEHGLEAGQMVTVDFPIHGINKEQFLIDSVDITSEDEHVEYSVTASMNVSDGNWAKFFYDLATKGRTYVIRENIGDNDVLTILESFTKTWSQSEHPNIFKMLYPSTTTYPKNIYPTFEVQDRVRYLSFFNNNTELFRKQITKQTISDDLKSVFTTVNINPNEANGLKVTHIGWWGGEWVTSSLGSGILLDKQPYVFEKTPSVSLQIDKTDLKGW